MARLGRDWHDRRVAIVCGEESFHASLIRPVLLESLHRCSVIEFAGWRGNPTSSDAARLAQHLVDYRPEVVIAAGGGSVIDVAKAARLESCPGALLAAVPTTAGSGSEATPYASLTRQGAGGPEKVSQNDARHVPGIAVLDPLALAGLTQRQIAVSGMDVLAHAIESYWSRHSVPASDRWSLRALRLVKDHFAAYLDGDPRACGRMQWAAYLAGLAISVTPTTACHAISYPLTTLFSIPHGWAVGLTLPEMLRWNEPCLGDRAAALCRAVGAGSIEEMARWIERLQERSGIETRLSRWGIRRSDLSAIVARSYRPDRIGGNPRAIDPECMERLLARIG